MYSNNHYEGINPIIISTVRKKARKLIKHKCFLSSDLEDLEQELMIDLLSNSPYAKTLFLRKFVNSFIDAIFAATNNLYLIAK